MVMEGRGQGGGGRVGEIMTLMRGKAAYALLKNQAGEGISLLTIFPSDHSGHCGLSRLSEPSLSDSHSSHSF